MPKIIKIDLYNSELYRFKFGAFFETRCISVGCKLGFPHTSVPYKGAHGGHGQGRPSGRVLGILGRYTQGLG